MYRLGRFSEGSQECPAHPLVVAESSLPGNDLDGMSPVLHEQTGSLDPQLFDRLRWRDARFRAKGAAELPWA
jgi:hypothetical protein